MDPIPLMSDVAQRFFAMFARMEFALKRCQEFRKNKIVAEADWAKFAQFPPIAALYDKLRLDPRAQALITWRSGAGAAVRPNVRFRVSPTRRSYD
jgi:hypothetical protein